MSKAKLIVAVVSLAVVGASYYANRKLSAKIAEALGRPKKPFEEAPVVEAENEVKADDAAVDTLNASSAV